MSFSIHPKLKEAIKKNNLVLFVGAGTSLDLVNTNGVKIGNWNTLIKNILTHLKETGHEVNHLEKSLKTNDALTVLNELEQFYKDIEKNSIYEFTNQYFKIDENQNNLEFQKKLYSLSSKIICTNYDKAFETACPILSQDNKVILRGNSAKIERLKNEDEFLLKLHGCYSQENTMVLFNSDYKKLYEDEEADSKHLLTSLSNLFYNKTILFIGYGMGDDEINLILNNIQKVTNRFSQKHFIISKEKIKEELKSFLTHILIDNHNELPLIIDALIEEKQNYEKEKDKELQDFIKDHKNNIYNKLNDELFNEALDFVNNDQFDKAIIKYKQISSLKEYSKIFRNWGISLYHFSKQKSDEEKENLLIESCEKYEKAIILSEKNQVQITYETNYYWGLSLSELSKLNPKNKKKYLLKESCNKLENATQINVSYAEAFCNWGISLFELSELKKENEKLLLDSCDKYRQAIKSDENLANAYYNLPNSLMKLATITIDKNQQQKYYQEAENLCIKSIELGDKASYNLSCLYAIQNNKADALFYLNNALENKEITVQFVEEDNDWILYRNDTDFITTLEKYKSR